MAGDMHCSSMWIRGNWFEVWTLTIQVETLKFATACPLCNNRMGNEPSKRLKMIDQYKKAQSSIRKWEASSEEHLPAPTCFAWVFVILGCSEGIVRGGLRWTNWNTCVWNDQSWTWNHIRLCCYHHSLHTQQTHDSKRIKQLQWHGPLCVVVRCRLFAAGRWQWTVVGWRVEGPRGGWVDAGRHRVGNPPRENFSIARGLDWLGQSLLLLNWWYIALLTIKSSFSQCWILLW